MPDPIPPIIPPVSSTHSFTIFHHSKLRLKKTARIGSLRRGLLPGLLRRSALHAAPPLPLGPHQHAAKMAIWIDVCTHAECLGMTKKRKRGGEGVVQAWTIEVAAEWLAAGLLQASRGDSMIRCNKFDLAINLQGISMQLLACTLQTVGDQQGALRYEIAREGAQAAPAGQPTACSAGRGAAADVATELEVCGAAPVLMQMEILSYTKQVTMPLWQPPAKFSACQHHYAAGPARGCGATVPVTAAAAYCCRRKQRCRAHEIGVRPADR